MDKSAIDLDARRLVKADSTSYPVDELTASENRANERINALIRTAEGRWQYDDGNETDLPTATTALVASQQDYSLDGTTHFRIQRVEVLDTAGNTTKLMPIDQADVYNQSLTDFLRGTGIPQYYDKVGNSLFLYPKPSYSLAAALKLYYERGPVYFTTADTSITPGFNPLFHRLISLWAAYDYAFINVMEKTRDDLLKSITDMEDKMTDFYSLRDVDDRTQLQARVINYR